MTEVMEMPVECELADIQSPFAIGEDVFLVAQEKALSALNRATLGDVEDFEKAISDSGLNQVEILNENGMSEMLHGGLYCRTLFIPKGTFLTGRIHRRAFIDVMISGDMTIKNFFADRPDSVERVQGRNMFKGVAGKKRIGFAHEDTLWITVDPCFASDLSEAVADITTPTIKDYRKFIGEAECQSL